MRLIGYPFLLIMLLIWLVPSGVRAQDERRASEIWVVSGELTGAYELAITAFRHELAKSRDTSNVRVITPEQAQRLDADQADMIVTLGLQAATEIGSAENHNRVINALLPSYAFDSLHQNRHPDELARISAVFIDQPVYRQIRLIREAMPLQVKVAIIASTVSSALADSLADEARLQGLSVRRQNITDKSELYEAMQGALTERAALIALPDRSLYNAETIQNILLTSFRMRSAVIGFSAAYVRAGALISVHSTPEQVGIETAQIVNTILNEEIMPAPGFPNLFEVSINPTVARSLGVLLDSPLNIAERLRQAEGLSQ